MTRKKPAPSCRNRIVAGFLTGAILVGGGVLLVARGQIDRLEIGIAGLASIIVAHNPPRP